MKIGVITDCFKLPLKDGIKLAGELGLDGIQIYATTGEFSPETLTEEQKAEYKALLKEAGLEISALCGDMVMASRSQKTTRNVSKKPRQSSIWQKNSVPK